MRIVVVTIVHHPEDARIRFRQIPALLAAGHDIVYLAPHSARQLVADGLTHHALPRASGRTRLRALRAARRMLQIHAPSADVVIIHDPELIALAGVIPGPKVWDVHEDLVAQISDKDWIPGPLHGVVRRLATRLEARGRRRFSCIIAEAGYRERFPDAPLVRNSVEVPAETCPPEQHRVVYLGRISKGRGAESLARLGPLLPDDVSLDVIGPMDDEVAPLFSGVRGVELRGFVPNDVALRQIAGATAGLSLLRDEPNYRVSMPTKILEYMARGIPVITTPLPLARQIVDEYDCGIVVPFDDPEAVAAAVHSLVADGDRRRRLGANGRRAAERDFNWATDARVMVDFLERVAAAERPTAGADQA